MNKLTVEQRIYVVSGALLLVIVLFVVLIIFPLIGQIRNDSLKIIEKRQAIDSFYQDWQNLKNSQKDYEEFQQGLAQFSALLPVSDAIKFITAIEDVARKTQNQETIAVLEKAPGKQTEKTPAQATLDFQISLGGNFPNLVKFLIYLENAPYYNDLNSLQVSRVSRAEFGGTPGTLQLREGEVKTTINLSVYPAPQNATGVSP